VKKKSVEESENNREKESNEESLSTMQSDGDSDAATKSVITDVVENISLPEPRGRGRPKRAKKMGRPRSSIKKSHDESTTMIDDNSSDVATKSEHIDPDADPALVAKRSRGRPKKGDEVNSKKPKPEQGEKVLPERERRGKISMLDPSDPKSLSKKRGLDPQSAPKKRGRPKGATNRNTTAEMEKMIERKVNEKLAVKISELKTVIRDSIEEHMIDLSSTLIEDVGARVTKNITDLMGSD